MFLVDLRVSYFADIAAGITKELLLADSLPIVLDWRCGDERKGIQRLLDQRVDGVILSPVDETVQRGDLEAILRDDIPLVTVDCPRWLACDSVRTDDGQSGRLAGEHLLALGHRRFGFCYYGEGSSACDLRLEGFRRALASADLVLKDRDVAKLPPRDEARDEILRRQLREILSRRDRPTALFASTDLMALEVYQAARSLGLRIPQDLSVVGCADLSFVAHIDPPLTTIRQDGCAVGRVAAQAILHRLDHPEAPGGEQVIPTQIVARQSTTVPPVAS